jgi:hypothetical protein
VIILCRATIEVYGPEKIREHLALTYAARSITLLSGKYFYLFGD